MPFILPLNHLNASTMRLVRKGNSLLAKAMLDRQTTDFGRPSGYLAISEFQRSSGYLAIAEFQANSGDFSSAKQSLMSALSCVKRIESYDYFSGIKLWELYTELACCAYLCKDLETYDFYIEKAKANAIGRDKKSTLKKFPRQIFAKIAFAQNKVGDQEGAIRTRLNSCFEVLDQNDF